MTLSLRRFDDRRPIMIGDIAEPKRNTMACQDVSDRDAEGRPRKWMRVSMEFYMTEAKRNRKRQAVSASTGTYDKTISASSDGII